MAMDYPKRLIEVDLPIKRISAHSRREKSIRHGHISTLHIWWARRPLAACRAVICASLWPDPADEKCPQAFRDAAARLISDFAEKAYNTTSLHATASKESFGQWEGIVAAKAKGIDLDPNDPAHLNKLRFALLDFIADLANWDNSTVREYLDTSRALTQAAHEALGGAPGTRPLVVDPFAGGGSIPLEALRVGADAFASDLNPVAVLLNKVVLEYIPKYGQRLAHEVRKWGTWVKDQAEKELAQFYPSDPDGAMPIAYLWSRTIRCEGPGCGAEVPLLSSNWLVKKGTRSAGLKLVPNPKAKRIDIEIVSKTDAAHSFGGTVRRGSATCPICNYTTPVSSVRRQLKERRGGTNDARLTCVVTTRPGHQGRFYRLPSSRDIEAVSRAVKELELRSSKHRAGLSLIPQECLDIRGIRHTWGMIYGMDCWRDFFTSRQALALSTLVKYVQACGHKMADEHGEAAREAVQSVLSLALDRQVDASSSLCRWHVTGEKHTGTFGRQAIPMVWDFSEVNVFSNSTGGFPGAIEWVAKVCEIVSSSSGFEGHAEKCSATAIQLPDDTAHALITDPPYYDAVPYAYLSDFFYVWLRRSLSGMQHALLSEEKVPKDPEIVVDRPHELSNSNKTIAFYESELTKAFAEARRVLRPNGIGTIVFASKTTASWEAILQAVVEAGWIVTGSWPIDTEMEARVAAQGQARLASSVHLVCRPRENSDGSLVTEQPGEWRDVLQELPRRIHEWLPRLAHEGIVGADAIFACLGPALEIFSRYSKVERADGSPVSLCEYLEQVWAAVAKEALSLLFKDADASGLEPDARLTAMWLWTVRPDPSATNGNGSPGEGADEGQDAEDEDSQDRPIAGGGYAIEFDAARKIAQGLGANLDALKSVVEVKGKTARLLLVSERGPFLFAKPRSLQSVSQPSQPTNTLQTTRRGKSKRPAKGQQAFGVNEEEGLSSQPATQREARADVSPYDVESSNWTTAETVLDRVHQSMLLFAKGQADALKRFLVDDGIGKEARFWRLAQSLSALYPPGTDEKRWVDGVLARKKGLGL